MPVMSGAVFAAALREMIELTQELSARRRFDEDVAAWLKEIGFAADFEAWRQNRKVLTLP